MSGPFAGLEARSLKKRKYAFFPRNPVNPPYVLEFMSDPIEGGFIMASLKQDDQKIAYLSGSITEASREASKVITRLIDFFSVRILNPDLAPGILSEPIVIQYEEFPFLSADTNPGLPVFRTHRADRSHLRLIRPSAKLGSLYELAALYDYGGAPSTALDLIMFSYDFFEEVPLTGTGTDMLVLSTDQVEPGTLLIQIPTVNNGHAKEQPSDGGNFQIDFILNDGGDPNPDIGNRQENIVTITDPNFRKSGNYKVYHS